MSGSWLTSLSCSSSINQASDHTTLQWVRFIFLAPCPQRVLFLTIDLLFLLVLNFFAIQKVFSRFHNSPQVRTPVKFFVRTTVWFQLSLIPSTVLALCYTLYAILALTRPSSSSSWKTFEAVFGFIQAITHIVIVIVIAHERRFKSSIHPMTLRIYWVVNFVIVCLLSLSAIIRLSTGERRVFDALRVDDILSLITLPIAFVLLIVAIRRLNGVIVVENESWERSGLTLNEPLLSKLDSDVGGYASASFFSKAVWYWLNPLLKKGYKSALKVEEVPSLPPDYQAERTSQLFESKWPKDANKSNHPVAVTLLRCYWKHLVFTAILAVIRLCAMYMGPVLLQSFVAFTSGKGTSPYQGYYLVLALLLSKLIEVLSSHQFTFQSHNIGTLIRSTLIGALYKKGLRLSSSSRQAHGLGQIVNYMAVDSQQICDMVLQLNNVWLMILQLGIALVLLYLYLGVSAFTALAAILAIMLTVALAARQTSVYQFNLMQMSDLRLKAMTELLNNMRVIKFQAWEEHFEKRIQTFRDSEYTWLWKFMFTLTANMVILWSTPVIMATAVFGTSILLGIPLDPGTIFTATSIFKILSEPIQSFPEALISIARATVSLDRLDGYLTSKELTEGEVEREEGCEGRIAVEVKDGVFSWDDEEGEMVLKDLNLIVKKGELAAIVGTVGSGKSSLLASVLGEMHRISGKVRVCGTTAYVAQTSWIQNGTIQDNILFGSPMDTRRYREAVRVCCLEKDLEMMEFGDQTEIGERGINLSGGQKQRIQLARAVYQDCDIYLLDDVFSAVDAHTGSELFKDCVRGALKEKTVLLVTHQVDFLHNADLILVMRDGMIVQSGKYNELLESGLDFKALVAAHETSMELVEQDNNDTEESPNSPKSSSPKVVNGEPMPTNIPSSESGTSKLIEDEERETGQVSWQVYKAYSTEAYGWWGVVVVLLMSILWQFSVMAGDYWLAYETGAKRAASFDASFFIGIYAILAAVSILLVLIKDLFITVLGLKTAQIFFRQILHSILHAPMSFFDTTPSGRVLSRASTDQSNIDFLIPFFVGMAISCYVSVLGIVVITCQVAWPTIFFILPLGWLNVWYMQYFLASSRELTRLDSITKAPIIQHFSESVAGVLTIRSFRKQDIFVRKNYEYVNANLCMEFHNNASNEWLGFRMELLGSVVLCISALFMVTLPRSLIKPEYVGLSLSYGLSLSGLLFFTVYMSCYVENRMVSVERIKQFTNIPSEAPWKIKDRILSPKWPTQGNIDMKDLQVRYRPNTPLILKGITLSIQGGQKIGVVGRTGSGKSTLIQALFRVVEPSGGRIIIDEVDISKLGLYDLRSRFGIIPQEPVLFQGTVRSNVDPLGLYLDEEIWQSLERCQLKDVVAAKPEKLDALVVDSGDNWSVGQRQLLCLGRVMLKHSRILFMDEATASVDSQTDAVIQKIIREDFAACTIITIAHRIPTVMDCDRVLVIDAGKAREFDKPSRLLEQPSLFAALVQEYANRSSGL